MDLVLAPARFVGNELKAFVGWLLETLIFLFNLEGDVLWLLNANHTPSRGALQHWWNWLGFYQVQHRTALSVFRQGQYVDWLEAPAGHQWHHLWTRRLRDEPGPVVDLSATFLPCWYDNVPTSMGPSLAERLSHGPSPAPVLPLAGRPVSIRLQLILGYRFEAPLGTIMDVVELSLREGPARRNSLVTNLTGPELERICGQLNPVDIRLRLADDLIRATLLERMSGRLRPLGYDLLSVEIGSVVLPDTLETTFVANQELMRRALQDYSPDELARMLAAQMGHGLQSGGPSIALTDIGQVIGSTLSAAAPTGLMSGPAAAPAPPAAAPGAPLASPLPPASVPPQHRSGSRRPTR